MQIENLIFDINKPQYYTLWGWWWFQNFWSKVARSVIKYSWFILEYLCRSTVVIRHVNLNFPVHLQICSYRFVLYDICCYTYMHFWQFNDEKRFEFLKYTFGQNLFLNILIFTWRLNKRCLNSIQLSIIIEQRYWLFHDVNIGIEEVYIYFLKTPSFRWKQIF